MTNLIDNYSGFVPSTLPKAIERTKTRSLPFGVQFAVRVFWDIYALKSQETIWLPSLIHLCRIARSWNGPSPKLLTQRSVMLSASNQDALERTKEVSQIRLAERQRATATNKTVPKNLRVQQDLSVSCLNKDIRGNTIFGVIMFPTSVSDRQVASGSTMEARTRILLTIRISELHDLGEYRYHEMLQQPSAFPCTNLPSTPSLWGRLRRKPGALSCIVIRGESGTCLKNYKSLEMAVGRYALSNSFKEF